MNAGPDCAECAYFSWPKGFLWWLRRKLRGPYDYKVRCAATCWNIDYDEPSPEDNRRIGGPCGPLGKGFERRTIL